MKDFYLFLSSEDSKELFPTNAPSDFSVKLPYPIDLRGNWTCALVQCSVPTKPEDVLYLEANFSNHVTFGSKLKAVLGKVTGKNAQYSHLAYIPVRLKTLEVIHLKVINRRGDSNISEGETSCILHFRSE